MKCAELMAALNEYVDGTVDPAICEEFEKHMAGCNPCQVVVDNIRQTITLYKEGKPVTLPAPFRQKLHTALRQRWKETHHSNLEPHPGLNHLHSMSSKLFWLVLAVVLVAAFLLLKRLTQVSPTDAREWLDKGALVIDVRSEGEFAQRHLPGAINIPLDRLRDDIARYAPDKAQPLLLHCLSGGRSALGKKTLDKLGYQHVFNLGSYGRAEQIVGQKRR